MFNLKKLFKKNAQLLPVKRTEKEILECFMANRAEFDAWFPRQQQPHIRFRFYYPTAVDFYYDEFKLFTAYFKRGRNDLPVLQELKMSEANFSTIRSQSWKPFEEVMFAFLSNLEEKNKAILFRKTKSLYEYAAICDENVAKAEQQDVYGPGLKTAMASN